MRHIARLLVTCLAVVLGGLSLASSAQAQYFGRNKVQYKDFAFEVLKTQHFDIYFYPEEREGPATSPSWLSAGTAAEHAAADTPGVTRVENRLEVGGIDL